MKQVSFGRVILDTRCELRLSPRDISERSNGEIPPEMLANIEDGKISPSSLPAPVVCKLAFTLGVNYAYLLTLSGHLTLEQLQAWNAWGTLHDSTKMEDSYVSRGEDER